MQELIDNARNENCYKLVLECREEKKFFYEKLGFNCSGYSMSLILWKPLLRYYKFEKNYL